MKQCFGYIRVSTGKQTEGVSLEAQQEAITAFASRNGLFVSRWFIETETASKTGRKIFGDMRSLLRRGQASGVIFHKIDRSSRNLADWAQIGSLYDIAGIEIHFAAEGLDFGSVAGRLAADMQAVVAAHYSRNLRQEVIKGLDGRLRQGLYPFKAPFGYVDNGRGNAKTIHPKHGDTVRTLYDLYGTGEYSLHSLTRSANAIGLRSATGRPLQKTSIEKILRNPFYMGLMLVRRTGALMPGNHEPLISAKLFNRVADIRAGRDNKKVTRHNHLFAGLFRCGLCDTAMIGERQKGRVYYRCQNKECETKSVREDEVEASIRDFLDKYMLTDDQHERLKAADAETQATDVVAGKQKAIRLKLAELEGKRSRLADLLIEGSIDDAMFQEKKSRLFQEQRVLEERLAELPDADLDRANRLEFLELAKCLISQYEMGNRSEKRRMVQITTSNRIVVRKDVVLEPSIELADLKKR